MNFAHIFETALLLLIIFLIGAILGYFIRYIFFRPQKAAPVAKPTPAKAASRAPSKPQSVSSTPAAAPAASSSSGHKPASLSQPREGKKDDLKRIKGVGLKIEETLNELGIYHFDQVADWSPETTEWINEFVSFKGRVQREKWVSQAQTLAQGKSTEFSSRVDKGEVPSSKK